MKPLHYSGANEVTKHIIVQQSIIVSHNGIYTTWLHLTTIWLYKLYS